MGRAGRLVIATRGDAGPGEVEVPIRGGTELFIARSPLVLARGTDVVCVEALGPRTVLVMPWADLLADPSSDRPHERK